MSIIASAKLGARLLRVSACGSSSGSCSFAEDLPEARLVHGVALLGGVSFGFFRKSLLFKGARCTSTGFWRHGLETIGEFVILLKYDMSELRERGGAQAAEATEKNQNVSLCRVKTWPQLMCYALI